MKAAESLKWEFNGTTKDMKLVVEDIETAVDHLPKLAAKVEKGGIK